MDTKIVMILAMIEMKISYQIKDKWGKQINFAARDNIQIKWWLEIVFNLAPSNVSFQQTIEMTRIASLRVGCEQVELLKISKEKRQNKWIGKIRSISKAMSIWALMITNNGNKKARMKIVICMNMTLRH